jgi:hypothetical protein
LNALFSPSKIATTCSPLPFSVVISSSDELSSADSPFHFRSTWIIQTNLPIWKSPTL